VNKSILYTPNFEREIKQLAKKYKTIKTDFNEGQIRSINLDEGDTLNERK